MPTLSRHLSVIPRFQINKPTKRLTSGFETLESRTKRGAAVIAGAAGDEQGDPERGTCKLGHASWNLELVTWNVELAQLQLAKVGLATNFQK